MRERGLLESFDWCCELRHDVRMFAASRRVITALSDACRRIRCGLRTRRGRGPLVVRSQSVGVVAVPHGVDARLEVVFRSPRGREGRVRQAVRIGAACIGIACRSGRVECCGRSGAARADENDAALCGRGRRVVPCADGLCRATARKMVAAGRMRSGSARAGRACGRGECDRAGAGWADRERSSGRASPDQARSCGLPLSPPATHEARVGRRASLLRPGDPATLASASTQQSRRRPCSAQLVRPRRPRTRAASLPNPLPCLAHEHHRAGRQLTSTRTLAIPPNTTRKSAR